jgi:hypothetical protein
MSVSGAQLLWKGCREGNAEQVKEAIRQGADLDALHYLEQGYGQPPFFTAALNSHLAIVRLVGECGGNLRAVDR